jgi:chemotaxis protein methyltransferase CheR
MEVVLNEKCFNDFLRLIHELTGITIAQSRTSMVEGRLRKRVKALGLPSYEAYLKLVREAKKEQTQFIDLITTNETYFFRTPRIWDYIENKFLPSWFAAHPKQVFNAWSAAASSGEEAFSLGVLCQAFKEKNPAFIYQIVGTDISEEMVNLCQQGRYSGKSIDVFKKSRSALFDKYMRPVGENAFEVLPEIKAKIRFQPHNLFRAYLGTERFDLVLIRNVFIYFSGEDQEKVLSLIVPRLVEDSALVIGESESLSHIHTPFKPIEPLIYRLDVGQTLNKKAA